MAEITSYGALSRHITEYLTTDKRVKYYKCKTLQNPDFCFNGTLYTPVDAISKRQIEYIERTVKIEGIVTNGLSSNVKYMKERLDAFCEEAEKRFTEIEKFSWFRQWMTGLRDNLFQNLLRLILIGGATIKIQDQSSSTNTVKEPLE